MRWVRCSGEGLGFKSCIPTAEVAQPRREGLSWGCRAEATIHVLGSLLPTLVPQLKPFPFPRTLVPGPGGQGPGVAEASDSSQPQLLPAQEGDLEEVTRWDVSQAQCPTGRGCP